MLKKAVTLFLASVVAISVGACADKTNSSVNETSEKVVVAPKGDANLDYFVIGNSGIVSLSEKGMEQESLVIPSGYSLSIAFFKGSYKYVSFESDDDIDLCSAFTCSETLESIILPANLTKISQSAFFRCTNLKSISFPSGVKEISKYCCEDDSLLENVTFQGEVTDIGDQAFCYCAALKSINLPDSVVTIGIKAFYDCVSLETVTLPKGLKNVGANAFSTSSEGISTFIVPAEMELESWDGSAFVQLGSEYTVKVSKGSWADLHFDEVFGGQAIKEFY